MCDKFAKWEQTWQLSLSSEKCCHIYVLVYLPAKNPVNYHINDVALNTVDTVGDLGISVDNKHFLTFRHSHTLLTSQNRLRKPT